MLRACKTNFLQSKAFENWHLDGHLHLLQEFAATLETFEKSTHKTANALKICHVLSCTCASSQVKGTPSLNRVITVILIRLKLRKTGTR